MEIKNATWNYPLAAWCANTNYPAACVVLELIKGAPMTNISSLTTHTEQHSNIAWGDNLRGVGINCGFVAALASWLRLLPILHLSLAGAWRICEGADIASSNLDDNHPMVCICLWWVFNRPPYYKIYESFSG